MLCVDPGLQADVEPQVPDYKIKELTVSPLAENSV